MKSAAVGECPSAYDPPWYTADQIVMWERRLREPCIDDETRTRLQRDIDHLKAQID